MRNFYKSSVIAICLVLGILVANFCLVFYPVQRSLAEDARNSGISLWAYHQWLFQPNVLVLDLKTVPMDKSFADVSRVLLQSAEKLQDREYKTVILAYQGQPKFELDGAYFKQLGTEYHLQNPVYTMRTLPENVMQLNGERAFGVWTGGIFGVITEQMKDFRRFHEGWYFDDMLQTNNGKF